MYNNNGIMPFIFGISDFWVACGVQIIRFSRKKSRNVTISGAINHAGLVNGRA